MLNRSFKWIKNRNINNIIYIHNNFYLMYIYFILHIFSSFSSVQFSRSVMSNSVLHESQHTRPLCPSPTPGVYSNSCPSSQWCHSRNTWGNRQIWPWSTEWSRAKANRVLPREHTGHSKHPLPTTQEKTTHGHHQTVNTEIRLIIFFAAKDGGALYSQQKHDQELTVAQLINSLLPNSDLNWRK